MDWVIKSFLCLACFLEASVSPSWGREGCFLVHKESLTQPGLSLLKSNRHRLLTPEEMYLTKSLSVSNFTGKTQQRTHVHNGKYFCDFGRHVLCRDRDHQHNPEIWAADSPEIPRDWRYINEKPNSHVAQLSQVRLQLLFCGCLLTFSVLQYHWMNSLRVQALMC